MRVFLTIILCFCFAWGKSQISFKTIVQKQSITAGEAFQVQYVLEGSEQGGVLTAPDFRGFRVSGPYLYLGSSLDPAKNKIKNTVYTLTAISPGRYVIRGAKMGINGRIYQSNDVIVDVISEDEAARRARREIDPGNTDYFLKPGEDPYEKIRKNLFVKVHVNKRVCFIGEPVVATFKLYSRLESKSDIVKNPGFYGFTVYDMVSLGDRQSSAEIVNGKTFEVHTIRQVQLFPLQDGQFIIDGMDIKNDVIFSRSEVNKKTEQEIVEGVMQDNEQDDELSPNTKVYETTTHTEDILITVKPLPKVKPALFNGATGEFNLSASVFKNNLAKNEEGQFELVIRGQGNFTQLNAPVINWPSGLEGFDPVVHDSLDKSKVPITGARIYRYAFVPVDTGEQSIPSVNFTYFNPATNNFKTVSTSSIRIHTGPEKKSESNVLEEKKGSDRKQTALFLIGGLVLLSIGLSLFFVVRYRKKIPEKQKPVNPEITTTPVSELLASPAILAHAGEKEFYSSLQQSIWTFFAQHLGLSGSEMKKEILNTKLGELHVDSDFRNEIMRILQLCETGMYTGVGLGQDREKLLQEVKALLQKFHADTKQQA